MNVAVKALQQMTLSRISTNIATTKRYYLVMVLAITVLLSALSVIYIKDINRRLLGQLQTLQTTRNQIHTEWGKLLLEKSVWDSQARIRSIAENKLDMEIPKPKSIVMVNDL